jgi:hypothetical protein
MKIQTWSLVIGLLSFAAAAGAEVKSISVAADGVL